LPRRPQARKRDTPVRTPLCRVRRGGGPARRRLPGGPWPRLGDRRRVPGEPALPQDHVHGIHGGGPVAEGIKPLSLELGGHAPFLVFADADLGQAVEAAIIAKFRNTGQSCIAANRFYVQREIYEPFLERFTKQAQALKVGPGLEAGVQVGPVINKDGLDKALEHVEDAKKRGARCLCGGRRMDRPGWFVEPTVLADVPEDAACMHEETFAPVAAVCAFDTEDEAVERANASPFGLSAYACTRDLGRAFRMTERLEAGTIGINDGAPTTSQAPFGGMKHSGWGRELGNEGLDAFLETKHVSLAL